MTSSDKEYINMTAKLTAEATVREFRNTLDCNHNTNRIGHLEQIVENGLKDKTEENEKGLQVLRKFIFWALMSIVLLMVAGLLTIIIA